MYPRTEYEMTEADKATLLAAMKSVPYMVIGGHAPRSQQDNANDAWAALGLKMGFDAMTVRPISGKGDRWFSAVPSETESAKAERLAREAAAKRQAEIARLTKEIADRQAQLAAIAEPAGEPAPVTGEGWQPIESGSEIVRALASVVSDMPEHPRFKFGFDAATPDGGIYVFDCELRDAPVVRFYKLPWPPAKDG